jgi:Dolichyl-phosphate-mannose-protein mannosyltransferase
MRSSTILLTLICCAYLILSGIFSTTPLDMDEFTFIREPYELLGGDYTVRYLRNNEYKAAARTLMKSYYFYWKYRPLNAPVISQDDRSLFNDDQRNFGYIKPSPMQLSDPTAIKNYQQRLIVPEPDRFYAHGAGKPLLPAILSIPQLALLKILGIDKVRLLDAEYNNRNDLLFSVCRLIQIFAGLASTLLVFNILKHNVQPTRACLATLIFAIFPVTIKYFPNLHHDSIMVPFILLAVYLQMVGRYAGAGVAYGLALASKNVAIILFLALAVDFAINAARLWRSTIYPVSHRTGTVASLRARFLGLTIMGAIAVVTLLPFANPVSYAQEILTPIISRPIDRRGENITKWTFKEMVHSEGSSLSPQVTLIQRTMYFHDIGFMFLILAVCLAIQKSPNPITRLSIVIMVGYLPMSAIFSTLLDYRTLLLVPFFTMAASELLQISQLRWLAVLTTGLMFCYVSDPGKTDMIHPNFSAGQHLTN